MNNSFKKIIRNNTTLNFFKLFTLVILNFACHNLTDDQNNIKNSLGKTVNLEFVDSLKHGNALVSLDSFLRSNNNVSIVYLQDGCGSCYPKFIKWQNWINSNSLPNYYSVLFIIKAASFEKFSRNLDDFKFELTNDLNIIIDKEGSFLHSNYHISTWVIDKTIMVDSELNINLVGSPFSSPQMTELFYKMCNN